MFGSQARPTRNGLRGRLGVAASAAMAILAGAAAAAPPASESLLPGLPAAPTTAPAAAPGLVHAELLADVAAIQPGKAFTLGVLLRIRPGWHVYWKNPGDAGLTTAVEFRLPKGFRAGPLRWPLPKTFRQTGDIVGYGYEHEVLLSAEVTPPRRLPHHRTVAVVRAEASWLACKDKCVPGQAVLEAKLPVAQTPRRQKAHADVFARWRARLPVPPARAPALAGAAVTGQIPPGGAAGKFAVLLTWASPPARVEWFPAAGDRLAIDDTRLETRQQRTRITFTARLLRGSKPAPTRLQTVVAYTDPDGRRRGVLVPVTLRKTKNARPVASTRASKRPSSVPPAPPDGRSGP